MPITDHKALGEYTRRVVQQLKDMRELLDPWHSALHELNVQHDICGNIEPFMRGLDATIREYDPAWRPGKPGV